MLMCNVGKKWEWSIIIFFTIVAPSSLFLILLLCRLDHVGSVPIPLAAINAAIVTQCGVQHVKFIVQPYRPVIVFIVVTAAANVNMTTMCKLT